MESNSKYDDILSSLQIAKDINKRQNPTQNKIAAKQSYVSRNPEELEKMFESIDESKIPGEVDANVLDENGEKKTDKITQTLREMAEGTLSEERKKEIEDRISTSKLPSSILESFKQNPIYDDETMQLYENEQSQHSKKVKELAGKATSITKKLDAMDKGKNGYSTIAEDEHPQVMSSSVDYGVIRDIINEAVNTKFSSFQQMLTENEGKSNKSNNGIRFIQQESGAKFYIVDNEDNVYSCILQYEGKNKKKK